MSTSAATRSATLDDLHALARERFLRGEKLEIQALAEELGVSRATAYRWAGNADELTDGVVGRLAEENFQRALNRARGLGAARVIDTMARGMRAIVSSAPYRRFLERDPEKALRMVASKHGSSQGRIIALHQRLLEEEVERGHLQLPVDAHTMAYALVRLAESFLYADLIAGEEPDIDKAVEILRIMLS